MNTERVIAVEHVVRAHRALQRILVEMSDDDSNRRSVQAAVDELEENQDLLFIQNLQRKVEQLKSASAKLGKVNAKIRKDTKKLKDASERVKKAARAIGILADIVSKAAAL